MNLINILTYNPGLFDDIQLPADLSKEDVVNEILQECATMEPLYGDPDLFHQMILHWFKTRNYTFQRLYDSMYLEYNPLENAYRTETRETGYTRDYSRDASRNGTETEDTENTGTTDTSSTQNTTSETTATSKDQVAPYNDDAFHDTTQTTGSNTANGNVENSGNEHFENSGNRELESKNSETISDNENGKTLDNFTLKGSIGLITPQQMIEQERDVVKFNLYKYIAMEFSKRFMIQVF